MANETKNWEYKPEEIIAIEIATERGTIEVIAKESSVKAEINGEYDEEKCEIIAGIENKVLKLSAKSKKKWFGLFGDSKCKAGFKVIAPKDKELILKSGAGTIKIKDFASGGKFYSGAGIVEFENFSGHIAANSGAGAVRGDIYSEEVDIKSGAGSIDLKWNKAPEKGNVSIKSGAGSTLLSFPEGTKMGISFKAGAGNFNSEFGSDSKSDFKIDYKSGAGSLNIKKREP